MQFVAKALYIPYSPYKLRPLANVIRGKNAAFALGWLKTYKSRRSKSVEKVLASAIANAKSLKNIPVEHLTVKKICVDQGPMYQYFKPGAMGRALNQRKRLCHISITLEAQEG